jgi:hypothetical protein
MKKYRLIKLLVLASCALLVTGCPQPSTNSMNNSEVIPETSTEVEVDSGAQIDPYDILARLNASGSVEWFVDTSANLTDIPVEAIYLTDSDSMGNGCAVWVFADQDTVKQQVDYGNFDWMSDNHWWWYGTDSSTGKGIILASNLEFGDCALQADEVFQWN